MGANNNTFFYYHRIIYRFSLVEIWERGCIDNIGGINIDLSDGILDCNDGDFGPGVGSYTDSIGYISSFGRVGREE
ncbi:hypothetical protein D3C81_1777860 [compost metagenome]